jgi:hypothetical protein
VHANTNHDVYLSSYILILGTFFNYIFLKSAGHFS